ncbi:MAG: hypothetical protein DRP09_18715 [Candidatus Thorarchaeota archaeon]|nr:MAG: hypothetical protein DRP09_18715 [Candidatus Thorarchaeota archaeon]
MELDFRQFHKSTTFIVGNDKHAGKTIFLKYALRNLRARSYRPAYMSIGVDGEGRDLLDGVAKPTIIVQPDDLVITSAQCLESSDAAYQILNVFPQGTVLGRMVLVNITRSGFVELTGPENNQQLSAILDYVQDETEADAVLVDGAVNRLSQVSSNHSSGFVMVMKVTASNLIQVAEQIRLLYLLNNLPSCSNHDTLPITGALTESRLEAIPADCKAINILDFTRVFLSYRQMQSLCDKYSVSIKNKFILRYFIVNLFDVAKAAFAKMLDGRISQHVVFNPFMEEAIC